MYLSELVQTMPEARSYSNRQSDNTIRLEHEIEAISAHHGAAEVIYRYTDGRRGTWGVLGQSHVWGGGRETVRVT